MPAMSRMLSLPAAIAGTALILPSSHGIVLSEHQRTTAAKAARNNDESEDAAGNPVKKVIALLKKMSKKVEDEGREEAKLYDKFECWCKTTTSAFEKDIAAPDAPSAVKQADIDSAQAELTSASTEVAALQSDKKSNAASVAAATAQRQKANEDFKKAHGSEEDTLSAASQALEILRKKSGKSQALVQQKAQLGKRLAAAPGVNEDQKQQVTALLAGLSKTPDLAMGTLEGIEDSAKKAMSDLVAQENSELDSFTKLKSSKADESQSLQDQIDRKNERIGELGVSIVDMKHQLKNLLKTAAEGKEGLAKTKEQCEDKAKAWEERKTLRNQELLQIKEAIKVMNADAAHETLGNALSSASLLQFRSEQDKVKEAALQQIQKGLAHSPDLNFLAMALSGKAVDFTKVTTMINDMLGMMKKQQADDDNKKAYCTSSFRESGRTQQILKRDLSDIHVSLKDKKGSIDLLVGEIASIHEDQAKLDQSVKDAQEQRAAEAKEFKETSATDTAAVQLINVAVNQLNKFYNPNAYLAKPSFLQVEDSQAPKTFGDTYVKNKDSASVIGMLEQLIGDITQELKAAESQEKRAQKYFAQAMDLSAERKATNANSIYAKEKAKADVEEAKQTEDSAKTSKEAEIQAAKEVEENLHEECDWLLKNHGAREAAREAESTSLKNAKATLAGAK
eukprot:TRINITY_DN243_c0_g4_i1.p1 TRINITY_DN243_c0_g4~~TRINITY_DN243_c0_g4_i1.p1  ORF type:complete len:679 (+),score=233.07 TRINITY_DN243_c0_g4_i1:67-2103(+)